MFPRKLLVSILVFALAGSTAFAKGLGVKKGQAGQKFIEKLEQRVNLSQSQIDGIRALAETRRQQIKGLKQDPSQRRQIKQQFISGVRELLTPEQLQQLPKKFR